MGGAKKNLGLGLNKVLVGYYVKSKEEHKDSSEAKECHFHNLIPNGNRACVGPNCAPWISVECSRALRGISLKSIVYITLIQLTTLKLLNAR